MKFSIIVPIYNVEPYIAKCIESVKVQTLTDFECLLVDDGTKDKSIEIAEEIIKDDKRFIVLHKENGGLSDARNYGLERANGEYVFFLDSDDYIREDMLEKTYEMAKKHDSDICRFDMYYEYDDGTRKLTKGGSKEIDSYKDNKDIIFENHSANTKIYRRDFLENKRFIKGLWYEDLATIPTWIALANNVSYVEEPLYIYYQRSGSISHNADPRLFDIYKSIDNIKSVLNIESKDVSRFYYYDALVETVLRIRAIKDRRTRLEYYQINTFRLDTDYPKWYEDTINYNPSFKQKIVFTLLKYNLIGLLDLIY